MRDLQEPAHAEGAHALAAPDILASQGCAQPAEHPWLSLPHGISNVTGHWHPHLTLLLVTPFAAVPVFLPQSSSALVCGLQSSQPHTILTCLAEIMASPQPLLIAAHDPCVLKLHPSPAEPAALCWDAPALLQLAVAPGAPT